VPVGKVIFLDLEEVGLDRGSRKLCEDERGQESYLLREGIGSVSERLDPDRFVRIHRSVIVNVRKIKELQRATVANTLPSSRTAKSCRAVAATELNYQRLIGRRTA